MIWKKTKISRVYADNFVSESKYELLDYINSMIKFYLSTLKR